MKKRNKKTASTEEMEFTFIPDTTAEQTVTPEEPETAVPETAELPPEENVTEIADDECTPPVDEPAPADDPSPSQKPKEKEKGILGICLPLIIICIGVALMLAIVNALTEDTIAAQAAAEKERAVLAIFPDATSAQLYETTEDGEIYLAIRDKELIGCCISLTSGGFAGDISMMVGRTAANEISGVQLVSMSESPGIGTKTKSESFLSQYRGGDRFVIGDNVDAIAGATVSSRAVTAGVNRALEMPLDLARIADAYGLTLPSDNADVPPADTTSAEDTTTPPAETDAPETAPTDDTTVPGQDSDTDGEETESTSSVLSLPTITPAAAVNRVVLVSSTMVINMETEAPETTPEVPDTEAPEDTDVPSDSDTSADTEDTSAPDDTADTTDAETSADTTGTADPEAPADTTGPAETETPADTTAPAESDMPDDTTGTADAETSADTDTTTDTDSVEPAVTESDSDAAAA